MTGQILSRTTDTDQNTVEFLVGLIANRPGASTKDQLYFAHDENIIYRDDGTAWTAHITSGSSVGTAELTDFKVADIGSGTGLIVSVGAGNFTDGATTTAITTANQTLTDAANNYIEIDPATPSISVNTTAFSAGSVPIAQVITSGGNITSVTDRRSWIGSGINLPDAAVTDNAIPRFDGIGGRAFQDSNVILSDTDGFSGISTITVGTSITTVHLQATTITATGTATLATSLSGHLRATAGVISDLQDNLIATTTPGATDDSTAGYGVGSLWCDVTGDVAYLCIDATAASAIWLVAGTASSVNGPVSSTDNALARFNGTGGDTLQNSGALLDDADNLTGITTPALGVIMDSISGSTFTTAQEMQNIFHSAGWVSGGIINDSAPNITVDAGTGLIRTTASPTGILQHFDWSALGSTAIPADTTRYVGVEYNAGSPQVVVRTTDNFNDLTDFILGVVVNEGGTLHIASAPFEVGDHAAAMIQRIEETMGILRDNVTGGLILAETGTRNLTTSAGTLWDRLTTFAIAAIDTSAAGTFSRYYRDGGGGFTLESAQTQWPNTEYDDGTGTLAVLANNKWATLWFYLAIDGDMIMMYGRAEHNSEALAEGEAQPNTFPIHFDVGTILIARLIFQKSAATGDISTAFGATFTPTPASGDVTGPASAVDNTLPRYDGTSGKLLQTSSVAVDDNNHMSGLASITIVEQSSVPATPASGNGLLYSDDATTPSLFHINDSGTRKNLLRHYDAGAFNNLFFGTTLSDPPVVLAINGAPSGQIVTYDGDTADEKAILDAIDAGTYDADLWIRNTTRSQNARIDKGSLDTTAKTFTIKTGTDITSWANNDVLTTEVDLGNSTGADRLYWSVQDAIETLGLERATLARLAIRMFDTGTIGADNQPPWIAAVDANLGWTAPTAFGQISGRYVSQEAIVSLFNDTAGEEGSFGIRIAATGSQTMAIIVRVLGYWA